MTQDDTQQNMFRDRNFTLYHTGKIQKEVKLQKAKDGNLETKCSFRPDLVARQDLGSGHDLDQLVRSKQQFKEQIEDYKEEMSKSMKKTMFRPQTLRGPKNQDRSEPIHKHLINYRGLYDNNKKIKQEITEYQRAQTEPIMTKSIELLEQKKINILENLFDKMDINDNGVISQNEINIEPLNEQLVEIFKPLFYELQERKQTFTKVNFVNYGLSLYN